jgi:hypothetical protein
MSGKPASRRVRAQRWYRLIVRLYPARHRRQFGAEMVQAFGDHYRDAVGTGRVNRWRFWRSVLADAGTSLVTEHVAALRAPRRSAARRRTTLHRSRTRGSARPTKGIGDGEGSGVTRRTGVRRRLRYRRSAWRHPRVVARTRRHRLVYHGRIRGLMALAVLAGAILTVGAVSGHVRLAAVLAGVVVVAWLAYRMRVTGVVPAGPGRNGPAPPGGASVREPRRPLPVSPAGVAARPRHDEQPPGPAAALI